MSDWVLKVSLANCGCDLRVNDVPVYEDPGSRGRLDFERFVTLLVATGHNALSFALVPPEPAEDGSMMFLDDAEVLAELQLVRRDPPPGGDVVYGTMRFRGGDGEDDDLAAGVTMIPPHAGETLVGEVLEADFESVFAWCRVTIGDTVPAWSWVRGETLAATPEERAEVMAVYRAVHDACARRDQAALRALVEENAREVAIGFGCELKDAHMILGLEGAMTNPALKINPLDDAARYDLFGYGRLARLLDADGHSALSFTDEALATVTYFDLFVARLPSLGWVPVR